MKNSPENLNENKDLEFVPFKTKDNIFNSDANWFPTMKLNNLKLDSINNQFVADFSNPINRTSMRKEEFNDIVYNNEETYPKINIKNINYDLQNEKREKENKKNKKSSKSSKKYKNREEDKEDKEENVDEPIHMRILREYNLLHLEEESRLESLSLTEHVYSEMKEENEEIFDVLRAYDIPDPIVDLVVKKIVRLTLDNCSKAE